jgi:hypothetical protein
VKYLTRAKEFCSCLFSIYLNTTFIFSADHPGRKRKRPEKRREGKEKTKKEKPADTQNSRTEKATEKNSLPAAGIRVRKSPSITFIRSGYIIR